MSKYCIYCHHTPCVCIREPTREITVKVDEQTYSAIAETKAADNGTIEGRAAMILKEFAINRSPRTSRSPQSWMI